LLKGAPTALLTLLSLSFFVPLALSDSSCVLTFTFNCTINFNLISNFLSDASYGNPTLQAACQLNPLSLSTGYRLFLSEAVIDSDGMKIERGEEVRGVVVEREGILF